MNSQGAQGDQSSGLYGGIAISADGRFIAFTSPASNLVSGDQNGLYDVFVRDRATGAIERVSTTSDGTEGNSSSIEAAVSADGRFVAFESLATNLVHADTNGQRDVFVRDRVAGTTERVSVSSNQVQADADCLLGAISGDGRFVTFFTAASNLAPGSNAPPGSPQVYAFDRLTRTCDRVSVSSDGSASSFGSASGAISTDGRFVVFSSGADNLVAEDTNYSGDIFLRDRKPCGAGTVNGGLGGVADVLRVNGALRVANVGLGIPLAVALDAAPLGPSPARYFAWAWAGLPQNQIDLRGHGQTLGCTVNPTPLTPSLSPQPILCLRGRGVPMAACGHAREFHAPPDAPWVVRFAQGLPRPVTFTIQGVLEDAGAANSTGFSVTNAVVVSVQ
ncbi:MAG: hypothetical protein HY292_02730 [Planctomycetes bacterium]|nr:hypothetical protein [Planctomycetota bacterium]